MEAGLAAQGRAWRLCADKYLEAYLTCENDWAMRYNCWSGYTSVLREDHFRASDADLQALRTVAKDASLSLLERQQAAFTCGYVLKEQRGDRDGAAKSYRAAIATCRAATAGDRRRKVMLPDAATGRYLPTPSGPIFDEALKTAAGNLASMENHEANAANFDSSMIAQSMSKRFQENLRIGNDPEVAFQNAFTSGVPTFMTPIGPNVSDQAAVQAKLRAMTTVGGGACDCCGKTPDDGASLSKCSRCGLSYYCSKECQKAAWGGGHKEACRAPGEVKVGDWLMLQDVANIHEYHGMHNGMIVEVQAAASDKGRWEVGMLGGEKGDSASIATEELKRLRPGV